MIRLRAVATFFAVVLAWLAPPAPAKPASAAHIVKEVGRIPGPNGDWDYCSFDPVRRKVYIAHGREIMMIKADTDRAKEFASGGEVHAVVPVPGMDVIVTTNSGDSSAKIIDSSDGRILASLPTPKDPDGAVFDPHTGLVLIVSGDAGKVSLVAPKARKIVGSIALDAGLEFPAVDGKGRLYVNEVRKNEVAVVDLATRRITARYPLPGCRLPTGLAYVRDARLISVCFNGVADILDADSGRQIASLKIGGFPDAVLNDPVRHLAYVPSAGSGTLAVIALSGPQNNSIIDTVRTQVGTRTGVIDPETGRIWLPSAKFKRYSVKMILAGNRPQMRQGTFQVLVFQVGEKPE